MTDGKDVSLREELPEEEFSLEEAFEKIDEMTELLQQGGTSLEESFRIWKQGMDLLKKCSDEIDLTEKKVMQIREDGELVEF